MLVCSNVSQLCYTQIKMLTCSLPEVRASWPTWAGFLRHHRLESLVAWILEAAGPLTVVGAQLVHLGSPLLRPVFSPEQADALASLLEDPDAARSFAAFLREESTV